MLIVLVGTRGAGKSTVLSMLKAEGLKVLQPTTTRPRRNRRDQEYDFVRTWRNDLYAWRIEVGDFSYGMRKTELAQAEQEICVTVFEPLNLTEFEKVRRSLGVETLTVGLDTITDLPEQHRRVANDPSRMMDEASFAEATRVARECDVVLHGPAVTVAAALNATVDVLSSRAGVLTEEQLRPLIRAGSLLVGADTANIRPASYDLRVGSEVLCQGKIVELTDASPHFEIPPYSYAIVSALELASLPPFVIARFDIKVSFFFEGVILSNGPQVDPNYKGALFCMLYNGSGRSRLLTRGKHFATIDFTTTTTVTEGYRQKYQLKERMAQFATDEAVTDQGGAIVTLIDQKVGVVDRKVRTINRSFWAIAAAVIALLVVVPTLTIPILWSEIGDLRTEREQLNQLRGQLTVALSQAKYERAQATTLLEQARIEAERRSRRPTNLR